MARKLPRLERVLTGPALFSIAYGEIASSIYFALGIALLAVTATRGGGATGYLIGVLFVALGLGRLYLLRSK